MLLYRVFVQIPGAPVGMPGHPTYLHAPQGAGRWDNTDLYNSWYLSKSPEGAIAETFGNLVQWGSTMFEHPSDSRARRAVATFSVPDDLALFDFDDAQNLLTIGMRPSQVETRNKGLTQDRAARLFREVGSTGARRWNGLTWWSFHRPCWTNTMLWATSEHPAPLTVESVGQLSLATPALVDAARALGKAFPSPLSDPG